MKVWIFVFLFAIYCFYRIRHRLKMQFELLPEDILNIVLDNLFPHFMQISSWKSLLPLLSVCQRLRHLYYPRIYEHVFIEADFNSDLAAVTSNINLVPSSIYPRSMRIVLQAMPGGYEWLKNAVELLERDPNVLSRVENLGVLLMGRLFELTTDHEIPGIETKISEKAEKMTQLFPAVNELDISGNGVDEDFPRLLTNYFATRLHKFSCVSYDFLSRPTHFNQITQLHIRLFDCSRDMLPGICPETIQQMTIYNLQPDYTWFLFSKNDADNTVVPYLCKLELGYIDNPETTEPNVSVISRRKLHFPQLKSLRLWGNSRSFPLLNMAVLPKCMDKIVLSAYPETYITFKGIVLPPARTLQCDIRDGSYTDDFSLCFNKLTQNSLNNEIVSIRMGDWFKDLHCPNLTSLQIDEAVDIKDVAAIIKTHSQLQSLSLDISSGNFDFSKDLKAVLDSAAPVKPLNTTLKELHYIGYDDISPANQTAVQYLVLQLPALNCLGGFDVDFKQFIQNYLPQYPHLANIVVQ